MFAVQAQPISSIQGSGHFLASAWSRAGRNAAAAAGVVRRARCRLSGHALMLHFEPHRLALQCANCGHTTPGWSIREDAGR